MAVDALKQPRARIGSQKYFLGVVSFTFFRLVLYIDRALWALHLFVFGLVQTACCPLDATGPTSSR